MKSFQTGASSLLLLCVLLHLSNASTSTTPPSEEIPRCNTSDMVEVNSVPTVKKSIDFWSCDQNLVDVRGGVLTTLIDTLHESPSFVFFPSTGFEYFEVLFRRGTRSTVFHTQKITDLVPGQYIIRIVLKNVPPLSYTPNLALEIGVTPLRGWRHSGNSNLNQFLDDDVWYENPGLKKYTCVSPPEPKQLQLSRVIIRVQGASEWQYIPMKDLCSEDTARNFSDPNTPFNDSSNRFSNLTTDMDPEYETSTTSRTTTPSSRTRSPPFRTTRPPSRFPPTPEYPSSTTDLSYLGYTSQEPRGPRLVTVPGIDHSFPADGFFEDAVKNDTNSGLMRMSTPLISGIIGGLAIILLIIGCCILFKHLNLRGSYGIQSNTYEAESSLHLRDSHYNTNATPATASTAATAATAKPHLGAPSITINDQNPEESATQSTGSGGQVNQSMDMSQEAASVGGDIRVV